MRKSWKLGAVSVALMAALGLFGCSGGDTTEQKADEPAAPQTETQAPEATEPEGETVELQIFAANSLTKAMAEAEELYTQQNPNGHLRRHSVRGFRHAERDARCRSVRRHPHYGLEGHHGRCG